MMITIYLGWTMVGLNVFFTIQSEFLFHLLKADIQLLVD